MADIDDADVITEEPTIEAPEKVDDVVEAEDNADEDVGSNVITFGDDEAPEDDVPATNLVKDLRKHIRNISRENADLKKAKADEKPSPLSAKPTLEQSAYDEEKFAGKLENWYAEKRVHDDAETAKETEAEAQRNAWQDRLGEYNEAKASLDSDTIDDAEAIARETLSETQQGVLIEALGKGAAPLLVGLAANEKRLKALAGIKNPIRFAAEAARLESIMKTSTRRPQTVPETRVVGSASGAIGDKKLEKLHAEAKETGDFTKYLDAKRKKKVKENG